MLKILKKYSSYLVFLQGKNWIQKYKENILMSVIITFFFTFPNQTKFDKKLEEIRIELVV